LLLKFLIELANSLVRVLAPRMYASAIEFSKLARTKNWGEEESLDVPDVVSDHTGVSHDISIVHQPIQRGREVLSYAEKT
jgi:hypothetical protein